jgi:hypothetical protein
MLSKDFKEFISLLNKNDVKYLIVGGYAVALHGHPRYTKDIDIWIEINTENAAKVVMAIKQFGFDSLNLQQDDFLVSDQVIQLGQPPNRIDILSTISGVDFAACYASRLQIEIDGININLIDLNNLKKNKQATGRLQDLADVEKLE